MMVEPLFNIPGEFVEGNLSGDLKVKGILVNTKNNQIVKHLPAIPKKKGGSTAAVGLSITAVGLITAAAFAGTKIYGLFTQKRINDFKKALARYVQAVKKRSLNESIIDELLSCTNALLKKGARSHIVRFSTDELVFLINCLCEHTKELANANSINSSSRELETYNKDVFLKFQKNLLTQKRLLKALA